MDCKGKERDLGDEFRNLEIEKNKVNSWNLPRSQLPLLPIEIIMEIISYLDNNEDILNCMMLCKQIRVLMYKTLKIMRKARFTLDVAYDSPVDLPNIKIRGKYIRNLKITYVKYINFEKFFYILTKVPNLEELTYECRPGNYFPDEFVLPELKHLKRLISNALCHRCFLSQTLDITKLETLKFCCENEKESEILTNFLCRQTKLKELTIYKDFRHQNFFLVRDICDEIQFKLTKFVYILDDYDEDFLKFLNNQAENLLELEIRIYPDYDILNTIFTKCKKLEKFTTALNCQFTPDDPSYWTLKRLQHFIALTTTSVNLNLIQKRFPNLKTLVCSDLVPCEGTFHSLETLHMPSFYDGTYLNKLKLPNLENLTVSSVDENMWMHTKRNFPKIENLTITDDSASDYLEVLKSLDYFKKLKTFKQMYHGRSDSEVVCIKLLIDFTDCSFYKSRGYDFTTTKYLNTKYSIFKKYYNFANDWKHMNRDELYLL